MARKVNIILDEHSEVFGTGQEGRPERERYKPGSVTVGTKGVGGPGGPEASGFLLGSLQGVKRNARWWAKPSKILQLLQEEFLPS